MECEHPLRFWAVFRARIFVFGIPKRACVYRCPLCRKKLEMEMRGAPGVLSSVLLWLLMLGYNRLTTLLVGAEPPALLMRSDLLLLAVVPAYMAIHIVLCGIGMLLGMYRLRALGDLSA